MDHQTLMAYLFTAGEKTIVKLAPAQLPSVSSKIRIDHLPRANKKPCWASKSSNSLVQVVKQKNLHCFSRADDGSSSGVSHFIFIYEKKKLEH